MTTPYDYIIKPIGERYNNVKKIEGIDLIVNTTLDETDFKYTNRIGEVIAVPRKGGELKVGDHVIVHHNTFRKWTNVRGTLKDSSNFVKEGHFLVGPEQLFAYDRGEGWVSLEDYCFVEPEEVERDPSNLYLTASQLSKTHSKNFGRVYISNPILEAQGVSVGDRVFFNSTASYRFDVDGKVLYKMSAWRNIKLVYGS